ncbi:MAG: NADH-quinone oxidoreductase subunit D [Chloroflexi bacterium]|nr:NADH-quinone oxidoreductase subunit D [Chloroflexota bacterium]
MLKTEPYVLNMGPQHPSTHGVFRMELLLDGETVVDMRPIMGYLHRGIEKLSEERSYTQCIPFTDRMDYLSSMTGNLSLCLAIEKLAGIEVSERAKYLRVIMAELQRIASHLFGVGTFIDDCGASGTPFLYMLREREKLIDLFEMASGARLTYSYIRPGGVMRDVPDEFWPAVRRFVAEMPRYIDEYEQLLTGNEILRARTIGVGILPREQAINASASGPVLRGSGVKWDLRKADPYCVYDRFDFDIPTGKQGDAFDRYFVRVQEMRQSVRILEQAIRDIPSGDPLPKVALFFHPPAGDAYGRSETPRGELGFYLVSDGSIAPYRFKIRSPSFINITALCDMVVGWRIADAVAITGSIDIVMGEVDR